MHPLLLSLLIDEPFTHSISLSITVKLMGTLSITLPIIIIEPQKSTIPITLPLLMTQVPYIFHSLLITGKTRYPLLNFWQLSVPIFITHYSLLQRVNNSWIFNRNIATRVNHLHWGNHAKPYALITKTYALIGKFEKCACTKVELERWKR